MSTAGDVSLWGVSFEAGVVASVLSIKVMAKGNRSSVFELSESSLAFPTM